MPTADCREPRQIPGKEFILEAMDTSSGLRSIESSFFLRIRYNGFQFFIWHLIQSGTGKSISCSSFTIILWNRHQYYPITQMRKLSTKIFRSQSQAIIWVHVSLITQTAAALTTMLDYLPLDVLSPSGWEDNCTLYLVQLEHIWRKIQ